MTTKQQIADRAAELIPEAHSLPEICADLEFRLAAAMSALDRMTGQRDQLAAQFKDANSIKAEMLDVLKAVFESTYDFGIAPTFDELAAVIAKAEGR